MARLTEGIGDAARELERQRRKSGAEERQPTMSTQEKLLTEAREWRSRRYREIEQLPGTGPRPHKTFIWTDQDVAAFAISQLRAARTHCPHCICECPGCKAEHVKP